MVCNTGEHPAKPSLWIDIVHAGGFNKGVGDGGGFDLGVFLQVERELIQALGLAPKAGLAMCRQFLFQLFDLVGL